MDLIVQRNKKSLAYLAFVGLVATHPLRCTATDAYIRIDQLGYPTGSVARADLMAGSSTSLSGAPLKLVSSSGATIWSGVVPAQSLRWSSYQVYSLDFPVAQAGTYTLVVGQPATATSPPFSVGTSSSLYGNTLGRGLSFYQNQRDGAGYIPGPLRSAAGHLNDESSAIYLTPTFDSNDNVVGTLSPTGTTINASGGWADAGDYLKFVQTHSYTVAIMAAGVRDFPAQMGAGAVADFHDEARFGLDWLLQMWDDNSRTLYYQTGIGSINSTTYGDHDLWRLPQVDDSYGGTDPAYEYIRNRPTFIANPAGSLISPNLAGRLAADFALCYQLFRTTDNSYANTCLFAAEHVFALADTAPTDTLLTVAPYDFYPETQWRDDLELGATELALALRAGAGALPTGLPTTDPNTYLSAAAHWATAYIESAVSDGDTLNLYDVSGLAHFELYRALTAVTPPTGLEVTPADLLTDLQRELQGAEQTAASDPFGFGFPWGEYDTATHGAGLAVTGYEIAWLTGSSTAQSDAAHWAGNILGANAWGVSFIVGDGAVFPDCIHHQIANLVGALDGSSPVLGGALVEGPNSHGIYGTPGGANQCPTRGVNPYARFNGNGAVFRDEVGSYATIEPAIDLTAASLLMFAWQAAGGNLGAP